MRVKETVKIELDRTDLIELAAEEGNKAVAMTDEMDIEVSLSGGAREIVGERDE